MVRKAMSVLLGHYAPRRNGMNRNKAANIADLLENQKMAENLISMGPSLSVGHDAIKSMLLGLGVRGQEQLVNDTMCTAFSRT